MNEYEVFGLVTMKVRAKDSDDAADTFCATIDRAFSGDDTVKLDDGTEVLSWSHEDLIVE